MAAQQLRNFKLFDAPVGISLQSIKQWELVPNGYRHDDSKCHGRCQGSGIRHLPQAAWNHFHPLVRYFRRSR